MKNKDWTGNSNSIYKTLGASNHTEKERQNEDYYATEPKATELLLELERFHKDILEPSCGGGHIAEVLKSNDYNVTCNDIIDRGYPNTNIINFFDVKKWNSDIITNPPYSLCKEFAEHALNIIPDGNKVAMFLKLQFLEGKARKKLFEKYPPKMIWVASSRLLCAKNGKFQEMINGGGSAVCYCWYIWEKGYNGNTVVKWFN